MRRLNVAITRAKRKLIIIGDKETLLHFEPFQRLFGVFNAANMHDIMPVTTLYNSGSDFEESEEDSGSEEELRNSRRSRPSPVTVVDLLNTTDERSVQQVEDSKKLDKRRADESIIIVEKENADKSNSSIASAGSDDVIFIDD